MKRLGQLARWPALAGLIILCCVTVHAQFTDGDIGGTVNDPSGAAVIGATVTVTSLQTGHVDRTQTDKIGYYRVHHLPPGTYQLRIEAAGFKVTVLNDVAVNASATTPADAKLQVGTAHEIVEVIEGAALVQTEEGRLDNTITTRDVENLPLNGRQVYQLVTEEPGVTATNAPVVSSVPSPTSSVTFDSGFIANGSTPRGNNFVLDGTSNNNEWLGGTPLIYPSLEAIQEVQVQTLNFSAEYGRNNGAIINIVTKSGTNDFHGSLFYNNRNTALDARNFFDVEKAPLQLNQFGFAFGGPIKKDKTFFFMDYEGSRLKDSGPARVISETPNTRSLAAPGSLAAMFFQDFPGPPCLATPGPTDVTCQAESPQIERNRADQYIIRVDHHIGSRDELFARWTSDLASGDVARAELFGAGIRGFTAPFDGSFGDLATGYTHQFSNNTLNDFRFSYSRNGSHISFGMPSNTQTAGILKSAGLPQSDFAWLYFDDGTLPFGGELYVPRDFVFNTFKLNDTLLHTAGRHSFKFGFEFNRIQENSDYRLYSSPFLEFSSIGAFAAGASPYLEQATVNADYGSPNYGQFTDTPRNFRWNRWATFVQDDWKVTSRLTLNLGVRWDVFATPSETKGRLSNIILGSGSNIFQQITTATVGRVKQLWNTDYHNFAPRIGLAWDPFGKGTSVIRSGFSIAYNEPYSNLYTNASRLNPPEANTAFVEPSLGIGTTDPIPYTFPFQPTPDFAVGPPTKNGGIPGLDIAPNGVDPHLRTAYAMQWFLGVQHSFGHDYGFTLNYVGTRGVGGYTREDFNRFAGDVCNQTSCAYANNRLNYGWGQITYISNESQSNYEGLNAQFRKNYSHNLAFTANYTFGKVLDNLTEGGLGDYSNVNGYGILYSGVADIGRPHLDYGPSEFDARHRFTLTGVWNIPAPKRGGALNKVLGGWAFNTIVSLQSGRPFDVYCGAAWYNGCDFNMDGLAYDRPNRPAGIQTSGFSKQRFVNGLFGDPTLIYPVGTFFSRTSQALQTFCPNGLNSILDFGPVNSGPDSQCVPVGTDGNLSRNAFRGPSFKDVDLGLVKNTVVSDRIKVEFRAEAFNLFNRVNLFNPISDLSSGQFGKSTAAFAPRVLQFGLKIMF